MIKLETPSTYSSASNLFEAFGLGTLLLVSFLIMSGLTRVLPIVEPEFTSTVEVLSQFSLLVTAIFVFFSYVLGRLVMHFGFLLFWTIQTLRKKLILKHSVLSATTISDRTWQEVNKIKRDFDFLAGLLGVANAVVLFQILNMISRDGTWLGLVFGCIMVFTTYMMADFRSDEMNEVWEVARSSTKPNTGSKDGSSPAEYSQTKHTGVTPTPKTKGT